MPPLQNDPDLVELAEQGRNLLILSGGDMWISRRLGGLPTGIMGKAIMQEIASVEEHYRATTESRQLSELLSEPQ